VQRRHKLVVVDVTVSVLIKDVCHRRHLQPAGGELCTAQPTVRKRCTTCDQDVGLVTKM
jgi:hypothetical protein